MSLLYWLACSGCLPPSILPMNEPAANWWKLGGRQEGTHMSVAQQERVINLLRAALDRCRVSATIVASEDNDERSTAAAVSAFSPATLKNISHVVTHTYSANDSRLLRQAAERAGKPLWVSEYGDGDRSGLLLARRIRDDIAEKHAQAWIYWQFVDGGGWGLVANRPGDREQSARLTRKFHVMAQFSRFIRPGSRILAADDEDSLAAYDPARKQLVIVTVNDGYFSRAVTFRFNGVSTSTARVIPYRTSQTEDVAEQSPLALTSADFSATLPPRSVTTFIIADAAVKP